MAAVEVGGCLECNELNENEKLTSSVSRNISNVSCPKGLMATIWSVTDLEHSPHHANFYQVVPQFFAIYPYPFHTLLILKHLIAPSCT